MRPPLLQTGRSPAPNVIRIGRASHIRLTSWGGPLDHARVARLVKTDTPAAGDEPPHVVGGGARRSGMQLARERAAAAAAGVHPEDAAAFAEQAASRELDMDRTALRLFNNAMKSTRWGPWAEHAGPSTAPCPLSPRLSPGGLKPACDSWLVHVACTGTWLPTSSSPPPFDAR